MLRTSSLFLAASLTLTACTSDESTENTHLDLSHLHSYRTNSEYAEALKNCPALYQQERECRIRELPPLLVDSNDSNEPTVDEIMNRVAVSHQWMGDNLRQALEFLPKEIRILARPLAAIVIDDNIRPSFFMHSSGMIYLDPAHLWLTADEKNTISDGEDYRAAYASQMTTLPYWRYVDGNDYAYPSNKAVSRSVEEMSYSLAQLLFHELAHANDFIEINRLPSLNQEAGFSSLINPEGGQMSKHVQGSRPLQSNTLLNYAAALYKGQKASSSTKFLTGDLAGSHFSAEGANTTYSYSTRYEDFAMLVEETLMLRHFGFRRDTAFVEKSTPVDASEQNYTEINVRWGQRGRIGDPLVKPRAQHAMEEILPDINWSVFFNNRAEPTNMSIGDTWAQNLNLDSNDDQDMSRDAIERATSTRSEDLDFPHL